MKYATPVLLFAMIAAGCNSSHPAGAGTEVPAPKVLAPVPATPKIYAGNVHEDFHVIVFGYNKPVGGLRPAQTHTFATWVRSRNKEIVEQVDISWCPTTSGAAAVKNEVPGRNKCLAETLNDAQGSKLTYWMLRTDRSFFEAAQKQRDSLKLYCALDSKSRPAAVNCIHACSDVAGELDTRAASGAAAPQRVADFYVAQRKAWPTKDDWVVPLLLKTWNCTLP